MNKEEFVKLITMLGINFNKDITQNDLKLYYEFLKDIPYDNLKNGIKKIISNCKYFPTIAEIKENCENESIKLNLEVIENMKQDNYFKSEKELDKILMWLNEGIIPDWFKKDYEKYSNKTLLEAKDKILIGV